MKFNRRMAIAMLAIIAVGAFAKANAQEHFAHTSSSKTQSQTARAAASINWMTDLDAAIAQAGRENKLVLIDVYTDWCGYCQKLDEVTYVDNTVIEAVNAKFVAVKINGDDGGAGAKFVEKHHIEGFPCTMIMDPKSQKNITFYGFLEPKEFIAELQRSIAALVAKK